MKRSLARSQAQQLNNGRNFLKNRERWMINWSRDGWRVNCPQGDNGYKILEEGYMPNKRTGTSWPSHWTISTPIYRKYPCNPCSYPLTILGYRYLPVEARILSGYYPCSTLRLSDSERQRRPDDHAGGSEKQRIKKTDGGPKEMS